MFYNLFKQIVFAERFVETCLYCERLRPRDRLVCIVYGLDPVSVLCTIQTTCVYCVLFRPSVFTVLCTVATKCLYCVEYMSVLCTGPQRLYLLFRAP